MDYKYINQLLERYWQGETSIEEEQILRSFFSQICVPEELQKYRSLFLYEQSEPKTDTLGSDFDERMMAMIDEPQQVEAQKIKISQRFAPLFKAAAMVAIVLTLSQAAQFSFQNDTAEPANTYAPRSSHGASVALNDSTRADSVNKANATTVQQSIESGTAILK